MIKFFRHRLFYLLILFLYLCNFFYIFYDDDDDVNYSNNYKIDDNNNDYEKDYKPIIIKKRPKHDFIVNVKNIEKNCGNWKKIMAKDCLHYLDKKESDYIVPYYEIKGASKPPSCTSGGDIVIKE